jgi:hypothetical protein
MLLYCIVGVCVLIFQTTHMNWIADGKGRCDVYQPEKRCDKIQLRPSQQGSISVYIYICMIVAILIANVLRDRVRLHEDTRMLMLACCSRWATRIKSLTFVRCSLSSYRCVYMCCIGVVFVFNCVATRALIAQIYRLIYIYMCMALTQLCVSGRLHMY